MEVCAVFGTLLGDFDGVYDPTDVNDRLLLGLKATISEVELHTMRSRLFLGKLNKARRGELFSHLPMGYVRSASGEVTKDPDEQVQSTLQFIFAKFSDFRTVYGLLRYLVRTDVRLPIRAHGGPTRGQLVWSRPNQTTLHKLLQNPMYAGAYCYGRHSIDPRRVRAGRSGRQRLTAEEAAVLLHDRLPAYISWEQFQDNQRQMAENRSKYNTRGVPRRGSALLPGLIICGRCGYRMRVSYGSRQYPRYMCSASQAKHGLNACQSLEGGVLDSLVSRQVLLALEPAAIELSLVAGLGLEEERHHQKKQWTLRIERARYESERAARQYHAVEPENRLVVRELERAWERALADQRHVDEQYVRWERSTPACVTPEDRSRVEMLSRDIPSLWNATSTSVEDRKAIVRHLVDHLVVNVEGTTEIVQATIHWAGGFESHHQLQRRVSSFENLSDYDRLLSRTAELKSEHSRAQIADQLTREGFHLPRRSGPITVNAISKLLLGVRKQLANVHRANESTVHSDSNMMPHEWLAAELARHLEIPLSTLQGWQRCGWIRGRKVRGWPDRWILYADSQELTRLQQLRNYQRRNRKEVYPTELTTPRIPNDNG
jgi:hypothetical protein